MKKSYIFAMIFVILFFMVLKAQEVQIPKIPELPSYSQMPYIISDPPIYRGEPYRILDYPEDRTELLSTTLDLKKNQVIIIKKEIVYDFWGFKLNKEVTLYKEIYGVVDSIIKLIYRIKGKITPAVKEKMEFTDTLDIIEKTYSTDGDTTGQKYWREGDTLTIDTVLFSRYSMAETLHINPEYKKLEKEIKEIKGLLEKIFKEKKVELDTVNHKVPWDSLVYKPQPYLKAWRKYFNEKKK